MSLILLNLSRSRINNTKLCLKRFARLNSSVNLSLYALWFNKSVKPSCIALLYIFEYSFFQDIIEPKVSDNSLRNSISLFENSDFSNLSIEIAPNILFSFFIGIDRDDLVVNQLAFSKKKEKYINVNIPIEKTTENNASYTYAFIKAGELVANKSYVYNLIRIYDYKSGFAIYVDQYRLNDIQIDRIENRED